MSNEIILLLLLVVIATLIVKLVRAKKRTLEAQAGAYNIFVESWEFKKDILKSMSTME